MDIFKTIKDGFGTVTDTVGGAWGAVTDTVGGAVGGVGSTLKKVAIPALAVGALLILSQFKK